MQITYAMFLEVCDKLRDMGCRKTGPIALDLAKSTYQPTRWYMIDPDDDTTPTSVMYLGPVYHNDNVF